MAFQVSAYTIWLNGQSYLHNSEWQQVFSSFHETVQFQTIQFSISKQFKSQNNFISSNST